MSRIFIDGFESGDHDMWDSESNAIVISSAGRDMDGNYCLDLNNNYEYLQKAITADDEMYFAMLYCPDAEDSRAIFSVWHDSTRLISIRRTSFTNLLTVNTGVVLATGTIGVTVDTTCLIEIYIKIADSGGRAIVKVNGITDIDFTGDTKPDANTQFNNVRLGYDAVANANGYYDNFIIDDANWIGDTKIQAVVPIGAGNSTLWDPSVGANWQCVDEKPASDADYVSTNVVDETDSYAAGNMIGTIDSVKCVQVQARSRTEGAPTPTNLKIAVRSGATDYLSGNKTVPAVEKGLWNIWETNPADSLAWEEADVNAMEIGFKSAA